MKFNAENFKKEQKLIVLSKKNRHFHKMNFSPSEVGPKIKLQYEEPEIIDEENNILIKVEFNNTQSNKNLEIENIKDDNIEIINMDEKNTDTNELGEHVFKLIKCKKFLKVLNHENRDKEANINDNNKNEELINENFTFKDKNNENNDYKSQKSKNSFIIPNDIIFEQLIHRTSDLKEEDNLEYSNVNRKDEEGPKINPVKHSLNISENMKIDEKNEHLISDELVIQSENNNENEKSKEKIIKPKINLHLSQNSLDDQLINREILNNINDKNNDEDKLIESPGNYDKNKLDDVFSFDAFALGRDENINDNENEGKNNEIFNSKVKLFISQNSCEEPVNEEEKKEEEK